MRKKTWIALVLAIALCLGTLGMVFAGDFGTIGARDSYLGGHPKLPEYQSDHSSPLDDFQSGTAAYKFVTYTFWLLP